MAPALRLRLVHQACSPQHPTAFNFGAFSLSRPPALRQAALGITGRSSGRLRHPLSFHVMQQARLNSITGFVPCLRGGLVAPAAKGSASSGARVSVSRFGGARTWIPRCIALPASPPSLLASALGGFQLRRHRAAAIAVASSTKARHNRSFQRTPWAPAELRR
jgi:hypothetical protein